MRAAQELKQRPAQYQRKILRFWKQFATGRRNGL
jgi:hypothetical protein